MQHNCTRKHRSEGLSRCLVYQEVTIRRAKPAELVATQFVRPEELRVQLWMLVKVGPAGKDCVW